MFKVQSATPDSILAKKSSRNKCNLKQYLDDFSIYVARVGSETLVQSLLLGAKGLMVVVDKARAQRIFACNTCPI